MTVTASLNSDFLIVDKIIMLNYALIKHLNDPNCSCRLRDILKDVFMDEKEKEGRHQPPTENEIPNVYESGDTLT